MDRNYYIAKPSSQSTSLGSQHDARYRNHKFNRYLFDFLTVFIQIEIQKRSINPLRIQKARNIVGGQNNLSIDKTIRV